MVQMMHFVCSVQNRYMNQWWFILQLTLGIKLLQVFRSKVIFKMSLVN